MIFTLAAWLYALVVLTTIGLVFGAVLGRLTGDNLAKPLSWPLLLLVGLAGSSGVLMVLGFFFGMGAVPHVVVLAIGIGGLVIGRRSIGRDIAAYRALLSPGALPSLAGWLLAVVLVLGHALNFPDHFDTGLYHAQTIRWIEDYPAVPGLANLHARFGFNSSWHLLQAFFSFWFLEPQGLRPLNGLLLVLAIGMGLQSVIAIARGDVRASRLLSAGLVLPGLFYLQRHIGSPLTDTPAILLTWMIWVAVLDRVERGVVPGLDRESAAIAIAAVLLVTVKLSAAPIVLLALVPLGALWRAPVARLLAVSAVGIALLVPWIGRSVVLTGTLIFPFSAAPVLPVEWALSPAAIEQEYRTTVAWARVPQRQADEVLALSTLEWTVPWWSALSTELKLIMTLIALAPLIFALMLPYSWRLVSLVMPAARSSLVILALGYVGLGYWFLSAPDVRFGLGFIMPVALLLVAPFLLGLHHWFPVPARIILSLSLVVGPLWFLPESIAAAARADRILKPAPYLASETRLQMPNGLPLLVPQSGDSCWYAPLPCAPRAVENLIARGCTLDAGFRIARDPERERRTDCAPLSTVQGRSRVGAFLPLPSIAQVQFQRRGKDFGPDIECDADRQNVMRVLAKNEGAPVSGMQVSFMFDDAVLETQSAAGLATGEQRWIESTATARPRRGAHTLAVRLDVEGYSPVEFRADAPCN